MAFEDAGGPELDAWVAKAEGLHVEGRIDQSTGTEVFVIVDGKGERPVPPYSTDEALANAIIEREGIEISWVVEPTGRHRNRQLRQSIGTTSLARRTGHGLRQP